MDIAKLKAAIDTAHNELNSVTDAAVKGKNVNGLRSLVLASNHLGDALKHIEKAAVQAAPKVVAAKA